MDTLQLFESKNMGLVNIGGDPADIYYRYKRPLISITHVRKGKGGRTQIDNMDQIQKALHAPDKFITSFYKKVKKGTSRAMIKPCVFNGVITVEELETILIYMTDKYLCCKQCKLPELNWGEESVQCHACGWHS